MKKKEPYAVVFDSSKGLQTPPSEDNADQSVSERAYGDLRIRSGNNKWGVVNVQWLVWSIAKQDYVPPKKKPKKKKQTSAEKKTTPKKKPKAKKAK